MIFENKIRNLGMPAAKGRNIVIAHALFLTLMVGTSAAAEKPTLPREADLRNVSARGPLHELAKLSYARQLRGHGGSDWNHTGNIADGSGRWMLALCRLGAYLHEKPEKIINEIPRMKKGRNERGFFGKPEPPEVLYPIAFAGHSTVLQWAINYTRYYGDRFGIDFARELADAFYIPRTPYLEPYCGDEGTHWTSEIGHPGAGFAGLPGIARLAMVTGEERYVKATRGLADLATTFDFEAKRGHAHATARSLVGLVYAYELTGEKRYLDAAIRVADSVMLRYEGSTMAVQNTMDGQNGLTEGCGAVDWLLVNMELGRATSQAKYFDRAERILWGPYLHHIRPCGGMGCDNWNVYVLRVVQYEAAYCCTMHAPNGVMRAFTHSVLAEDEGLTIPLYFPFTTTTEVGDGKKVRITMETSYPDDGAIKIRIDDCATTDPWALRFRAPAWSEIASIEVNGKRRPAQEKDGWVTIKRAWRNRDEVSFKIPLRVWFSRPRSFIHLPRIQDRLVPCFLFPRSLSKAVNIVSQQIGRVIRAFGGEKKQRAAVFIKGRRRPTG